MAASRGQTVVRVEGLRDLQRRLRQIDRGLVDGFKDVHRIIALTVLSRAQPGAPQRSGRLLRSGRASGTQRTSTVRYGGARVPYAGPIHYGWPVRKIEPHPWLLEAAHTSEPTWLETYNAHLRRLVEETPQ